MHLVVLVITTNKLICRHGLLGFISFANLASFRYSPTQHTKAETDVLQYRSNVTGIMVRVLAQLLETGATEFLKNILYST